LKKKLETNPFDFTSNHHNNFTSNYHNDFTSDYHNDFISNHHNDFISNDDFADNYYNLFGKFESTDIPQIPSLRDKPQTEVTFDVNKNSILGVCICVIFILIKNWNRDEFIY